MPVQYGDRSQILKLIVSAGEQNTSLYVFGSVKTSYVHRKTSHFWLLSVAQKCCMLKFPNNNNYYCQ